MSQLQPKSEGAYLLSLEQLEQLVRMLDEATNILILPHTAPDGDALGSTLGLMQILRHRYPNKQIHVISPDPVERYLSWLPLVDELCQWQTQQDEALELIGQADLVLHLDHNRTSRLRYAELIAALEANTSPKILIDHHLYPDEEVALSLSFPRASSTCELVCALMHAIGFAPHICRDAATLLLSGIITDTGRLMYNCFETETFDTVSRLLALGADYPFVIDQLSYHGTLSQLRLQGYVLHQKLVVMPELRAAYFTLDKSEMAAFDISKGDTEGLVNLPLSVEGIDSVCFLREDRDQIKLSFRSIGDFPVNELAMRGFGGGGHLNAAGAEHHGPLDEAKNIYLCELKKLTTEYNQRKVDQHAL